MFKRLREIFWGPRNPDEKARDEAARVLEMDEPMAGAGALLSGIHHKSETEKILERAADQNSE